jgi:hypothetical protein
MSQWIVQLVRAHVRHWTIGLVLLVAALVLSSFAHKILLKLIGKIRQFRNGDHSRLLKIVARIRRPAQTLVIFTGIGFILPLLDLPTFYLHNAQKALGVVWFLALGWLMISLVYCFEDFLLLR